MSEETSVNPPISNPTTPAEPVALTPGDLAAIRQRCEAATPPPWGSEYGGENRYWVSQPKTTDPDLWNSFDVETAADAEFIAKARIDVPRLLDEIDRLQAELTESKAAWQRAQADLHKTAEDIASVIDDHEPETWAWPLHGLRDIVNEANWRTWQANNRVATALEATWRAREAARMAQAEVEVLRTELDQVKADILSAFADNAAVSPSG